MTDLLAIDLFSGIGGFSLGLQRAGYKTVQFVEIDPFCQKVLNKNFPGVPIHDDIKTFKYSGASPFILTAGTPCQPASCAGKRRGKDDDRWLWDEVIRVIRHVKSRWIILENVLGLATLAEQYNDVKVENKTVIRLAGSDFYKGIFSRQEILQLGIIIQKVEDAGYQLPQLKDGTPIILVVPACAVGAPHRRDRVWIVANSRREYGERAEIGREFTRQICGQGDAVKLERSTCHAADTGNQRLQGSEWPGSHEQGQAAYGSTPERNHAWDEPWIEAASRLCRVDDGLPRRMDRVNRLKALGNTVMPQIIEIIGRAIRKVEGK